MARAEGREVNVEFGEIDGVQTVALIAVNLEPGRLRTILEQYLDEGNRHFVLDISGVGGLPTGVLEYLAKLRASLAEQGGDMAVVVSAADRERLDGSGYEGTLPVFDGTQYAAQYINGAANSA